MEKLKFGRQNTAGIRSLSREEMKKVLGGVLPGGPSGCGVKVGGNWHPSGQSASATSSFVGSNVDGSDNQTWWSIDGGSSYIQGSYSGTVTNWCCDSCPWNASQTA